MSKKIFAGVTAAALAAGIAVPAFAADDAKAAFDACMEANKVAINALVEKAESDAREAAGTADEAAEEAAGAAADKALKDATAKYCSAEKAALDKERSEAAAQPKEDPKADTTVVTDLKDLEKLSEKDADKLIADVFNGDKAALEKLGLKDKPAVDANAAKAAELEKAVKDAVAANKKACTPAANGQIADAEKCLASYAEVEKARKALVDFGHKVYGNAPSAPAATTPAPSSPAATTPAPSANADKGKSDKADKANKAQSGKKVDGKKASGKLAKTGATVGVLGALAALTAVAGGAVVALRKRA